MSTNFYKRIVESFFRYGSIMIVLCILFYTAFLQRVTTVFYSLNYYFLLSGNLNIEASTAITKLEGGAGYLIEDNGEEFVVFSVYLDGDSAEKVRRNLLKEGEETKILSKSVDKLYLKTPTQKRNATVYLGGLRSFQDCVEILNQTVTILDNGGTQEDCKRRLTILQRQMEFLSKELIEGYSVLSKSCKEIASKISRYVDTIVYAKDLRYLLCEMAEENIRLVSVFKL